MLPSVAQQSHHLLHHHLDHQPPFDHLDPQYDLAGSALRYAFRQGQQHGYADQQQPSAMLRQRVQYQRPVQRPNDQDQTNVSMVRNGSTAENTLRRKTPNGTLAAGYDGTLGDHSIQRPALKHILVSLDNGQVISPHSALPIESWQYKGLEHLPSSQFQNFPQPYKYDVNRSAGLPSAIPQNTNGTSWIRSLHYPPGIDSMLNQTTPLLPSQRYYMQNGPPIPTVLASSLQSTLGPTASGGVGPYGPYWPDGAYIPYRPAASRDLRYRPSPAFGSVQDNSAGFASLQQPFNRQSLPSTELLTPGFSWNPLPAQLTQQNPHQLYNSDPVVQQSFPPRHSHQNQLDTFWEQNSDPYRSRSSQNTRLDAPHQRQPQLDNSNWQALPQQKTLQGSTSDIGSRPRNTEFKEKILSWAHSVYVDLLTSLHHTRRKNAALGIQDNNARSKPNIYPKPPRQPASDFESQSSNADITHHNVQGVTLPNQQFPRTHSRPMDMMMENQMDGGKQIPLRSSVVPGNNFMRNYHDDRVHFAQHPNHRLADSHGFDNFRTMRRSSGGIVYGEASVIENATYALDILSSLCLESGWEWIDGMLVGGCLAYGLGDYDKALRWYTRILNKDASHVEAISNLAATLFALDRREEALNHWLRAVKLRPSYFEAVEHLIGLLCSTQRGKEAVNIIEFVEANLRAKTNGECFKMDGLVSETDSETESRESSVSTTESMEKAAFDYEVEPASPPSFGAITNENAPGFGSSGYAIPGCDNGRMLALIHAKGNMLYALGDNAGAASAFEDAILIGAGRRRRGIRSLIKLILSAFEEDNRHCLPAPSQRRESTNPLLLYPDKALQTATLVFPPQGNLPGFQHIPDGIAKKAAISTTSNSLLSLAKIYQDGMSTTTPGIGASKTSTGVRDILALYYLSLSLQPSPSTANNVGILLASVQQNGPQNAPRPSGENQLPDIPGVVPGSGIALALGYYNYGLNLDSKHAHLYTNLGSLLKDIGQLPAAIKMYEQAVQCDNKFDIALANLANAVKDSGRINDAIGYYKRAVAANPEFAEAVCGLANALNSVCNWGGRGGIAANNGARDRWHVDDKGMLRDAKEMGVDSGWIKRVVEIVDKQLKDGEMWGSGVLASMPRDKLGLNLALVGQDSALAHYNASLNALLRSWAGQKWEGSRIVRLVERAIKLIGWRWYQDRYVHGKEYPPSKYARPQLPTSLTAPNAPTVLPFHTFTCPLSAKQIRHISQRNGLRISCSTLRSPWLPGTVYCPPPPPNPHLNVGYVSSDFNNHPLAHLMQSVFGLHNPHRVKAFCYATTSSDNSVHRKQIEREAPVFRDVSNWPVDRLVEQIVKDEIHILINLNGYTRGARNEVFAARPAPIHMSFMGFAGTLGAEWCDYILADQISIPPETLAPRKRITRVEDRLVEEDHAEDLEDWIYGERIVFTRHTFFCCDHRQSAPDSQDRRLTWEEEQVNRWKMRKEMFPDLRDDAIILGNFNQLYKIEPTTFRTWLRILARIPNAILWLLRFPDLGEQNLKQTAVAWAGEATASRIVFTDVAPKHAHISRARICDLFLDTPECNAHTTAADVLWSGTPLLTLPRYKYKMCSRMASSILTSALPQTEAGRLAARDLISSSDDEYENRAISLGLDLRYELGGHGRAKGRLVELRKMLFLNRWESKLFDTKRWVNDLEDAYDAVWLKWVRGEEGDVWL
ncbi:UDP-N-acetylglucosaminyltransferase [Histoplasma capsulatum G186AR]|uniref:protein O-GlcNAc transferase n=2 Tax=Ajellomyces capsulatus TaxID=5037 RepID=C0NC40_AJECG|nr:UDP-N-acetylglucosaminyltransferase [Histoplasma capsulatum G186AR]EEH11231.1 UDP-N-acetylglucosaminyltransferase [Histoplasma capsulatum G186AR]KAG5302923.1 UDP-N-acetylglucosaminyltransferase [Histoplasma capsulatum]QSS71677.1 UDP-N-acetylglucosaminyltransferase [Histoplasma capsulatum G186AR]